MQEARARNYPFFSKEVIRMVQIVINILEPFSAIQIDEISSTLQHEEHIVGNRRRAMKEVDVRGCL